MMGLGFRQGDTPAVGVRSSGVFQHSARPLFLAEWRKAARELAVPAFNPMILAG